MAYGDIIIDDLSFTLNGKLETTGGDPVTQGYGMIYQVNPPAGSQPFQAWLSVDVNGNFSTSAVNLSGSSSLTVQVMFTQRGTLYSSNITFDVPEPGSIVNLGDITMRAGGQIKGRVKISGGDFITSGYINFRQEGATGEGSHYNSNIDEQGYFIITGPPSTTLSNMLGSVYVGGLTYETSLMSLSFPSSGNLNDIGTVTVTLVQK